jgi:hypothetical protein
MSWAEDGNVWRGARENSSGRSVIPFSSITSLRPLRVVGFVRVHPWPEAQEDFCWQEHMADRSVLQALNATWSIDTPLSRLVDIVYCRQQQVDRIRHRIRLSQIPRLKPASIEFSAYLAPVFETTAIDISKPKHTPLTAKPRTGQQQCTSAFRDESMHDAML